MTGPAARRRLAAEAERIAETRQDVRAWLEAIASGQRRGYFGLTPEAAAEILEHGYEPDPQPWWRNDDDSADFIWSRFGSCLPDGRGLVRPPGMSARGVVRELNRLGQRVPLRLVLIMLGLRLRELYGGLMRALVVSGRPAESDVPVLAVPVLVHPHTGPPAGVAALEVLVISP